MPSTSIPGLLIAMIDSDGRSARPSESIIAVRSPGIEVVSALCFKIYWRKKVFNSSNFLNKFNFFERKIVTFTDFFRIFPLEFELTRCILAQGTAKMVRLSECSSYRGFELSSHFYEKVLVKVQGEFKSSSSY